MRLTVQPENLLEAVLLKLQKIPHPFLFLEEDWGSNYDVVFLSNILHCLTAEQ